MENRAFSHCKTNKTKPCEQFLFPRSLSSFCFFKNFFKRVLNIRLSQPSREQAISYTGSLTPLYLTTQSSLPEARTKPFFSHLKTIIAPLLCVSTGNIQRIKSDVRLLRNEQFRGKKWVDITDSSPFYKKYRKDLCFHPLVPSFLPSFPSFLFKLIGKGSNDSSGSWH